MPTKFSPSADRHRVPRRSSWHVVMTATGEGITTDWGETGTLYVGTDDRGVELEVITVARGRDELVVHSMPTGDRHHG